MKREDKVSDFVKSVVGISPGAVIPICCILQQQGVVLLADFMNWETRDMLACGIRMNDAVLMRKAMDLLPTTPTPTLSSTPSPTPAVDGSPPIKDKETSPADPTKKPVGEAENKREVKRETPIDITEETQKKDNGEGKKEGKKRKEKKRERL